MFKEHLAYAQTPERTASILVDEASAVHKGLLYAEVFPKDPGWYSLNTKTELGDLIIMDLLLQEQLEWDLTDVKYTDPVFAHVKANPEKLAAFITDKASSVHKRLQYTEVKKAAWKDIEPRAIEKMFWLDKGIDQLCNIMGWTFLEVGESGKERFFVRMKELREGKRE